MKTFHGSCSACLPTQKPEHNYVLLNYCGGLDGYFAQARCVGDCVCLLAFICVSGGGGFINLGLSMEHPPVSSASIIHDAFNKFSH